MQEQTIKAYCLKVSKKLGEATIRLAANIGLLNKDLKIRQVDDYLYVPLSQEPTPEQIAKFEKELPRFGILVQDFVKLVRRPRKLFEAVGDRLPPHLLASFPHAIDFVGDIAVVEIPPELQDYKGLIGDAIIKVHKRVRTVLAKSGAVTGTYRLREYEVIAGLPKTETTHKEYGCRYQMDLNKVYFSPRLSFEHFRVASQVKENETVIDMFAGVGPFSILIAKIHRNVIVYAVDINPYAIEYLKKNIILNGVQTKVIPILGDAEKVARDRFRGTADRVIMNLPERAVDYLKTACDVIKPKGGWIHYYEFYERASSVEEVKNRLSEMLNKMGRKVEGTPSVRFVREVAPFKWQIAVDIKIC